MRPCFKFVAATADQPSVLSIYDEIGFWGVQAKDFISELGKVTSKVLNVEINSPGGDVFAGLAIYNALKGSGKEIVVKVMGVAASAASLVAMAGDKIVMPKNTFMMIHNPWSFAAGNADELRDTAATLDKIGGALLATYAAKTGMSEDDLKPLLAKDTWMTADEALASGFATEVVEDVKAKASFDMGRADLPAAVKAVFAASQEADETAAAAAAAAAQAESDAAATAKAEADAAAQAEADAAALAANPLADQIVASAKAAGLEAHATVFALSCTTMADAQARMASAREIVALCALAKRPDDAGRAIRSNTPVATVREQLIAALAEADEHTDGIKPNKADATSARSGVDPKAIWTSHRNQQPSKGR